MHAPSVPTQPWYTSHPSRATRMPELPGDGAARFAAAACVAAVLGLAVAITGVPSEREAVAAFGVAQLQAHDLACEHGAQRAVLAPTFAEHCALVAEELRRRVYGGELDRLLAWRAGNRDPQAQTQAPTQRLAHRP